VAVIATFALAASDRPARAGSTYTFDAIFDDARGLVAGQLLKIAGANAGSIDKVTITPDFKARIEMSVGARFAPFRTDAHCTIRPQGLIAENYVECDPGRLSAPPLQPRDGHPPTIPVAQTTEPVSLLDLFDIANLPTAERFSIIVNELGIGLSGNGQNVNDIIVRASPALSAARRVLSILHRQRAALRTAITASDAVVGRLAAHAPDLEQFVTQAARLSTITAAHSGSLARATARLPSLLNAARPALANVDELAITGTPLLERIHGAVPEINKLTADLGPFARAVAPVLSKLAPVLKLGTETGRDVTPLVKLLANYARKSLASTIDTGNLFVNLRDHGFAEAFLASTYYLAAATARFDNVSHFAVSVLGFDQCSPYVATPTPGCDAHIGGSATVTGFTPATPAAPTASRLKPLLRYLLR
jgi:virulence factor Mce-like protein